MDGGDGPYICPADGCESTFTRRHNLKVHLIYKHSDQVPHERFPDVFIKRRPGPKRLKSPLLPLVQASAQIRRTVSESAKTRRPEPPRSAFTPVKWSSSSSSQAGLTCGRGNLSISSTLMSSSTEILEALEMGSAHACEKRRSAVIEVWSEQSHSLSCSAPFHYNATCQ